MTHPTHYDVVVVGAGPAGNAAAFDLARSGASVALLEKHRLPRHKTCGGGMPMMVSQVLALSELKDIAAEAFVEADTRFMRHTFQFADPIMGAMNPDQIDPGSFDPGSFDPGSFDPGSIDTESATPRLSLWMVRRSVFDHALAKRAESAGATLQDGVVVRELEVGHRGPLKVHTLYDGRDHVVSADYVVGADGANGIVARSAGLRRKRTLAIAIEAEVPHVWGSGHPDLRPEVCHLEYGAVRRGYAWVFPKGDHLNVGAGVFRPRGLDGRGDNTVRAELRHAIVNYLTMLGVPHREDQLQFNAHPLPIWDGLHPLQAGNDRILLAGDAAGLINPFFGDGILHALKSGQIAARCILARDTAAYTAAIGQEFGANFDAALKLAKFFYQWPGFCYRHGVKRPGATRTATRLLCGEAMFDDISGRVMRRIREAMRGESSAGADAPDTFSDTADA